MKNALPLQKVQTDIEEQILPAFKRLQTWVFNAASEKQSNTAANCDTTGSGSSSSRSSGSEGVVLTAFKGKEGKDEFIRSTAGTPAREVRPSLHLPGTRVRICALIACRLS